MNIKIIFNLTKNNNNINYEEFKNYFHHEDY